MSGAPPDRGVVAAGLPESLDDLLALQPHGIASRVIARSNGGNITLFAIDAGEGLSEHSTPFEAMAVVFSGRLRIQVGDATVSAGPGQVVRLPANVPHAVHADEPAKMMLVMLK
jgi:quercetin dioxygenase-like cupin family protein